MTEQALYSVLAFLANNLARDPASYETHIELVRTEAGSVPKIDDALQAVQDSFQKRDQDVQGAEPLSALREIVDELLGAGQPAEIAGKALAAQIGYSAMRASQA